MFNKPGRQLTHLHTTLGIREVAESVRYCNRCNACTQVCPTYQLTQKEAFSPRGRNQIMRLILEEKIKPSQNRKLIEDSVRTCLLCGRCSAACAGKIPTAEHMLELGRRLHITLLPSGLKHLFSWRNTRPKLFDFTLSFLNLLRKTGLVKLLRLTGILYLPFLRPAVHADDILPKKIVFLNKQLLREKIDFTPSQPAAFYLPSLEAAYLDPSLGRDALRCFGSKKTYVLFGFPSGLFEYLYGQLPLSRHAVKKLIHQLEITDPSGRLPLVTDSADVYHFLKNAAQLFSGNRIWSKKAKRLAKRTKFLADYAAPLAPHTNGKPVLLDSSGLFSCEDDSYAKTEKILKTHFKKNFVEYFYGDTAVTTAAYSFINPGISRQLLLQKVKDIALTQTGTVVTVTGLCALELQFYLSRYYPHANAQHFARLHR